MVGNLARVSRAEGWKLGEEVRHLTGDGMLGVCEACKRCKNSNNCAESIADVIVEDLLVKGTPEEAVAMHVQKLVAVAAAMGEEGWTGATSAPTEEPRM